MAYGIDWTSLQVDGSTVNANDIDLKLTNIPDALKERLEDVLVVDVTADPWVLKDVAGGPVTGKRMLIPAFSFQPHQLSNSSFNTLGWTVVGDSDMLASLILPPGVTVTLIEFYVSGLSGTINWEFNRPQHGAAGGPAEDTIASGSSATSGVHVISSGVISHTIASDRYYNLLIYSSLTSSLPAFILWGARITYNVPSSKETL